MHELTLDQHVSEEMQTCIQNCLDCHSTCLATVPHCLRLGGQHASASHITTMFQCAEICQTSANLMLMNATIHKRVCGICAQACDICAEDCERIANGDEQMLACAEVCRRCSMTCNQMAA